MSSPEQTFSFLRGALRGAFGVEDLTKHSILIRGMTSVAQDVLIRVCVEGSQIYFSDSSVRGFYRAHHLCGTIQAHAGENTDVVLDFDTGQISLAGKNFSMGHITQDSYTQGIHEFYGVSNTRPDESSVRPNMGPAETQGLPGERSRDRSPV